MDNGSYVAGFWFGYLAVNIGLSALVGYVANQKGRSRWAFFFVSFVFSFIVGILVVLALPRIDRSNNVVKVNESIRIAGDGPKEIKCPFCAEWVKAEAKVCKHCGKDIESDITKILADHKMQDDAAAQRKLAAQMAMAKAHEERVKTEGEQRVAAAAARADYLKSKKFKIHVLLGLIAAVAAVALVFGIANISQSLQVQAKKDEMQRFADAKAKVEKAWKDRVSFCGADDAYSFTSTGIKANDETQTMFNPSVACVALVLTGSTNPQTDVKAFTLTDSWNAAGIDKSIGNSPAIVALKFFESVSSCKAWVSAPIYTFVETEAHTPAFGATVQSQNASSCVGKTFFGAGGYANLIGTPNKTQKFNIGGYTVKAKLALMDDGSGYGFYFGDTFSDL